MSATDGTGLPAPACASCPHAIVARVDPKVVPAWVLPFLRLRAAVGGDNARAWAELPAALPPGVTAPSLDEAAAVAMVFGLV